MMMMTFESLMLTRKNILSHLDKTVLFSGYKENECYVQYRNYIAERKEQAIIKMEGNKNLSQIEH